MTHFPLLPSMLFTPRKLPHSAWLGHIPFAAWLIDQLKPRTIVELGTHRGASFLAFCQAVEEQKLTSRVFAIDSWEGDEHAGFYGNDIYAELRDYQQRHYAGISEMMRMRFNEALEYFADGSVDLLHIDGLHTYEAVREDFETWLPKLSSRAVVLFHDCCVRERGFGVWQYWDEISQQYPAFQFTHTHGLGVLLVGAERSPRVLELAAASDAGEFAPINQLFDLLGRNIKNVEEIERVNAGLTAAHAEINRLNQREQELQQVYQQSSQDSMTHYAALEQQIPSLALSLAGMEQRMGSAMEGLQEKINEEKQLAEARTHSVITEVSPRLQNNENTLGQLDNRMQHLDAKVDHLDARFGRLDTKVDRLLRPWWKRLAGR